MAAVQQLPKNHSKHYTDEEVDYILDNLGYMTFKEIGKRLGRRPENIEEKLSRMGMSVSEIMGYITANQLAKIIGIDGKVVTRWINKKGLPAKRKYIRVNTQKLRAGKRVKPNYLIDINLFWDWAEKNKGLLDLRRMDPREYMPGWANELRFQQLREKNERDGKSWEAWEVDILKLDIKNNRLDVNKLSRDFKRSKEAVQIKVRQIKGKRKTSEDRIKEKYGVDDVKEVLERKYFKDELTVKEIADEIGMSKDTLLYVFKKCDIKMNRAKKNSEKHGRGYVQIGQDRLLITGCVKAKGYTFLRVKAHPHAPKNGLIAEQRIVMEQLLNRYLKPGERIIRRNKDKSDNRPENLYIQALENQKSVS